MTVKIKVLRKFKNPKTNRFTKVGEEMNVSENIFWLKRLEAKDCEKIIFKKAKSVNAEHKAEYKEYKKDSKKGSK